MTISQQVFLVFFAIFWGAIFNVQSRWKMFQPIFVFGHIRRRFLLSFVVVNVAPILFFVCTFYYLRCGSSELPSTLSDTFNALLAGVLPSFAIFGFYRVWMAIVELAPNTFYRRKAKLRQIHVDLAGIEPTIEELHLTHPFKWWNLLLAAFYFAIAFVGLWIA